MNNPYQTPESVVSQDRDPNASTEAELASRWKRLFAAIIDSLIGLAVAIPFWMATDMMEVIMSGKEPPYELTLMGATYGFVLFIIVQGYFLAKNGQTIGKKLLGMRITDLEGRLLNLSPMMVKRYLPISVAGVIPIIGQFLLIIDVLFIFRNDKRCIHDLIAGTKVVKVVNN